MSNETNSDSSKWGLPLVINNVLVAEMTSLNGGALVPVA